jgi:hypothetical protein
VPIYAGFDEVATKNELQATVWLELPDNVPANTPLEVGIALDADGILEKVRVALLDGSGAQVESYLDRGDGQRSRLEKKLDQLKRKKDEVQNDVDPSAQAQFEELYGRATKALSSNDPAAAAKHAEEMARILAGVGGGDPEWKKKAQWLCNFTEVVLEYSFLLDPPRTQQLKTLVSQVQGCIGRDDEAGTAAKYTELDKATDNLPAAINMCINMRRRIGMAINKRMDVEANQLRVALTSIVAALQAGDHDRAMRLFDEIRPIMLRIEQAGGGAPQSTSQEDYVEKR